MGTSALIAIVQCALAPVLLVVALAVRHAGASRPLNGVDYARIAQPDRLHRWAGNRLLLLPLACAASGVVSWRIPAAAWVCLGLACVACLWVAVWITLGAERFQRESTRAETSHPGVRRAALRCCGAIRQGRYGSPGRCASRGAAPQTPSCER